ncbi:head-tail joining protein, partial [Bartonella vinsonii]|uniref:head-tail joining protein n=1 Tax=Bartonella vinsonii TaxID=33047 RepID=UPI001ABA5ABB
MRWHGLLSKMVKDVRNAFGHPVIYRRKDNQQSSRITAIDGIKHSESDAGGRIPTTIARKELDLRINDIGGLPPKPEDSVVVVAPETTEDTAQEHFTVTDVQAAESGMYKLI